MEELRASGSSSMASFIGLPLHQLAQEEYPRVRYWTVDVYSGLRRLGRNNDEDGVDNETSILSCYMEDEEGRPVPESTRAAARALAKGFFNLILEKGRAPATWGDASIDIANELIHRLESEFPFLRLCKNHWKSKKLATNSYSQWHTPAIKRRAAALAAKLVAKPADTDIIDVDADNANQDNTNRDETSGPEPQKRPRAEDNEASRAKRPRTEETNSAPQSRRAIVTTQRQRVCKSFYYDYMRY
jgi:hypothetical protein